MILIQSIYFDASTNHVISWLEKMGAMWHRINTLDSNQGVKYSMKIDDSPIIQFSQETQTIDSKDIKSVWYRRYFILPPSGINEIQSQELYNTFSETHYAEMTAILGAYSAVLGDKYWLSTPGKSAVNKIESLLIAKKVGLEIPDTVITTSKKRTHEFFQKHGRIITKPIKEMKFFKIGSNSFAPFTSSVTLEDIESMNEDIYPSLFQQYIDKEFEIRSFFIEGRFFSMAMFSQDDETTMEDFRNYNPLKLTRRVPYKLPDSIENKLREFMNISGLNNGSIDIICGKDKQFYFLEVNPVGQFGMTSYPCNYKIEKIIAQILINQGKHEKN